MTEKIKVTFVVPEQLQKDMRQQIIKDGYSLRAKSKWVSEAIVSLLQLDNYKELVSYGDAMQGFEKVETIVLEQALKRYLDKSIIDIRRSYPTLEGVQSQIIRTSIVQRLIRS